MKTTYRILGLGAMALAALASCKKGGSQETSASGLKSTIYGDHKGKKPNDSSAVEFHLVEMNGKDSVLQNSRDANGALGGKPLIINLGMPRLPKHYKEALLMLNEGDSGTFEFPTDTIFKEAEQMRPPFLPKGSNIKFKLHLISVLDKKAYGERTAALRREQVKSVVERRNQEIQNILATQKDIVKKDNEALDKYIKEKGYTNVQTTPSGLRYVMETEGTGPQVQAGDRVLVNYTGRLFNGKVFDTSVEEVAKQEKIAQPGRPYQPFNFIVGSGQVIMGWDEGIPMIKKGGKAKLIIPSYLAYGPQSQGDIPSNSPLAFDVEVVDIVAE